jgi:hypothetical protein
MGAHMVYNDISHLLVVSQKVVPDIYVLSAANNSCSTEFSTMRIAL